MKWTAHKHTVSKEWYVKDEENQFLIINIPEKKAKLIAAAPELLTALRELVDATARVDDEYYDTIGDAENKARALLASIEGS